jgi:L-threonylcarbamoyladenylate synthase
VLSSAGTLPAAVTAGTGKVGVRIPDHPVALAVLRAVGEPLVVTSANLSGQPAATEAGQVLGQFEDRVDLVLDGGPCALGQESTILDMTVLPPRVLRKGAIGWPALAAVLAEPAGTQ